MYTSVLKVLYYPFTKEKRDKIALYLRPVKKRDHGFHGLIHGFKVVSRFSKMCGDFTVLRFFPTQTQIGNLLTLNLTK